MMSHPQRNGLRTNPQVHAGNTRFNSARCGSARSRWGVILAGGDGTRLQPLTRLACGEDRPKQFCPLLGGETLLAHTQQRISGIIDPDRVLFVLTKKHERFYQKELAYVPAIQKIVQPHNQGTLPAILWSLLYLFRGDEGALVAFFPSDHYFANEDAFIATVEDAFNYVGQERGAVILLGAGAERPETGYGWIEPGSPAASELPGSFVPVRRFWEKPSLEIAGELLKQGCLWNTFVMVGSVGAFLGMIRQTAPVLFKTFKAVLLGSEFESEEQKMHSVYAGLDPTDFSRKVLALSTDSLLVANCGEVGWSDLGEPRRFIAALTRNGVENPWATADVCNKCGLTRDQVVTLSGHEGTGTMRREEIILTPS